MKKTITITIDTDSPDVVVNTPDKVDDGGYKNPTLKEVICRHLNFLVDVDKQKASEGKEKPFSELDSMERAARLIRLWEDDVENSFSYENKTQGRHQDPS